MKFCKSLKLTSAALAAAMLLSSLIALPATAADDAGETTAKITLSTTDKVTAGAEVNVAVNVENFDTIAGADVKVTAPEGIKIDSYAQNYADTDYEADNIEIAVKDNTIGFVGTGASKADGSGKLASIVEVIGTNELFTFKFTVPEDAAAGDTYTFTVVIDDTKVQFCTSDEEKVTVSAEPFVATVVADTPVCEKHTWKYTYSCEGKVSTTNAVCSVCNATTSYQHTRKGIVTTLAVETGVGINIKYYEDELAEFSDVYAVATAENLDHVSASEKVNNVYSEGTKRVFRYQGLSAIQLCNDVTISVYGTNTDGLVVLLSEYTTSAAKITERDFTAIPKDTTDATKQKQAKLYADLVNYASEAQTLFGYNTDNLAVNYSANMTEWVNTFKTEPLPSTFNEVPTNKYNMDGANVGWTASIEIKDKIVPRIKINKSSVSNYSGNDDFNVVVKYTFNGKEETLTFAKSDLISDGNYWTVAIDSIYPNMVAVPFTTYVNSGETNISNITYNIEGCARRVKNDSNATVVFSMIAYGRSAAEFFN